MVRKLMFKINWIEGIIKAGLITMFFILDGPSQLMDLSTGSNFSNELIDAIIPLVILFISFGIKRRK